MSDTYVIETDEKTRTFEDETEWQDTKDLLDDQGVSYEASVNGESAETDTERSTGRVTDEPAQDANAPGLSEDPIGYLRAIDEAYVNTIKGTPAISKRGFRFIQFEHDITTESEVVGWTEDPYGVVVWARAELPDGRAAEAHGEGYPDEKGMDSAEFVRYADTRAKNRAISDLTSAGELAVSELEGGMGSDE